MLNTEKNPNPLLENGVLNNYDVARELATFASELSSAEITENKKTLELFVNILQETEYFNDVELRKEAIRLRQCFGLLETVKSLAPQDALDNAVTFFSDRKEACHG
jgi:hypothetical protein